MKVIKINMNIDGNELLTIARKYRIKTDKIMEFRMSGYETVWYDVSKYYPFLIAFKKYNDDEITHTDFFKRVLRYAPYRGVDKQTMNKRKKKLEKEKRIKDKMNIDEIIAKYLKGGRNSLTSLEREFLDEHSKSK